MAREFKNKLDIRDALYDIKSQTAFISYVQNIICEQEVTVRGILHDGMSSIFDLIQDQIDEIDKAIQNNVYEVIEQEVTELQPKKKLNNVSRISAKGSLNQQAVASL